MVHGYHVIFGAYGFWLPNDPRGSYSDFVGKWELLRFGPATKTLTRKELSPAEEAERLAAKQALRFPPVQFTGLQAQAIGAGFADSARQGRFTIWACAILPEHVHLVLARSRFSAEQMSNFLKGSATKALRERQLDPMAAYAKPDEKPLSPWGERRWKVYLYSAEAIQNAIAYVNENPIKEGKPPQTWSFVEPFRGLDESGVLSYPV